MAAATGYSFIGPTAPSTGAASAPYTVTLTPIGGTSASVTITPASTGNGTFNPATVALSTASPSATFTYTPTGDAVGSSPVLSCTNSLALTNPGNLTLTIQPPQASMQALAGDAINTQRGLSLLVTPGNTFRILHTVLHLPGPIASASLVVKALPGSPTALITKAALLVDPGQVQADGSYTAKVLFSFVPSDTTTALAPGQTYEFGVAVTTVTGAEVYETCEACSLFSISGGPIG